MDHLEVIFQKIEDDFAFLIERWREVLPLAQKADDEVTADMLAGMQPMDAALRASGHFGPRVDVPEDASVQDRLLAFVGRRP